MLETKENEKELKKSKTVAIIWVALSLFFACFIGVVGRAFLTTPLEGGDTEKVFIKMILQLFTENYYLPVVGGIFLCGILAAIMSTADSQLLVCASSASKDIFKNIKRELFTNWNVFQKRRRRICTYRKW